VRALFLIAGAALCLPSAWSAELYGRVTDPSGAAVWGALVHVGPGAAVTDREGRYGFAGLAPGAYRVVVTAPAFTTHESEVSLGIEDRRVWDVALEIGSVRQSITVKAPAAEGETETRTRNHEEVLEIRNVRESAARDAGEALAALEGVWKIRKGGIANDVVLRGFQQGNLNVLLDGARIYGACPNHMDPAAFHVDFAEIRQIDVTKGVFDLRNQGSLGGSIDVVTKTPASGWRLTPTLAAGSFGYFNPSLTASVAGENYYASGGYSRRLSDPFRDGRGNPFTAYANYRADARDVRAFDTGTAWFKMAAGPASRRFAASYTRQNGGQTLYPYLMMDALYDNADRLTARFDSYSTGGFIKSVRALTYFTTVRHWMTDALRVSSAALSRPYSMATFAGTRTMGGRLDVDFAGFDAGVEVYRRAWGAVNTMQMAGRYTDQPSIPAVVITSGGAFLQYRNVFWRRLQVTGGMRFDAASADARSSALNTDLYWAYKGTRARQASDRSPSGSLWAAYVLRNGLEIFAGAGDSVRFPDPQERFFTLRRGGSDWVGNPEIASTHNREADAGIQLRRRAISVKATAFYSRLSDYIVVHNQPLRNPVPGIMNMMARSYDNTGATLYGGEVSYAAPITRQLLLSGGISYTDGHKAVRPELRIFSAGLAELPPLRSRTVLRWGNRFMFAEAEGLLLRRQSKIDTDLREDPTPGYGILSFRTGVHAGKVNFSVAAENLLNRFYYEHLSFQRDPFRLGVKVPEPGRNLFVMIAYRF
jgi:iron complex outermembrane recepter protein